MTYKRVSESVVGQLKLAITQLESKVQAAEEAEDAAKDAFWSIYHDYLARGGAPVNTEAARSALAARVEVAEGELVAAKHIIDLQQDVIRQVTAERDQATQSKDVRYVNQGMGELLISSGWVGGLPSILFWPRPDGLDTGPDGTAVPEGVIDQSKIPEGATVLRFGTMDSFIRLAERMTDMVEALQKEALEREQLREAQSQA